jgi:two-component system sensor histidine kinase HydH
LRAVEQPTAMDPLSSIKGLAQFLGSVFKKNPENENYANVIVSEVDRINQVVTDLLVLAKPFDAKPEPINVIELVNHTILLVQNEASSHDITIRTVFGGNLEGVPLDASQMTQVLLNLLLNAIQSLHKSGDIEVGAQFDLHEALLTIWVEDNGPGIPEETKHKIFDPFFTTRESGTGLGLAIVNKIIENHDGEIQIKSPAPDKKSGCRISMMMPIDKENIQIIE